MRNFGAAERCDQRFGVVAGLTQKATDFLAFSAVETMQHSCRIGAFRVAAAESPAPLTKDLRVDGPSTNRILFTNAIVTWILTTVCPIGREVPSGFYDRSEERRVGKECRSRW